MRCSVLLALMTVLIGFVGPSRASTPTQQSAAPPLEARTNGEVDTYPVRWSARVPVSHASEGDPDYAREFVVAAASTAASVVGGLLGSLFGGPGLGTVGGAAVGAGVGGVAGGIIYDAVTKKPKPKPIPPEKK